MNNNMAKFAGKTVMAFLLFIVSSYGADRFHDKAAPAFNKRNNTCTSDIAFVSVLGSRPEAWKLRGFEHAVLYNVRGEIVRKIDIGKDSIYSLDKMIQENRARGPLVVRMYR